MILLTVICISGCGPQEPYDFRKDFHLLTSTDEFEGFTMTEISGMGYLERIGGWNSFELLLGRKYVYESGRVTYTLLYQRRYSPGDSLHPEELIFLIDGEKYRLKFAGSKRDGYFSSSGFYHGDEWAWASVSRAILEKIANASEVKFRVVGFNKSNEYKFNERYFYCFKRFYEECVSPSQ